MDKCTTLQPDNGILFNIKKKWAIEPWKDMKEHWMRIIKWKIQSQKDLHGLIPICEIPTTWDYGKAKLERITGLELPEVGAGKDQWAEHRGFREVKILHMI